ncbi:MAG: HAD-IC family P-type ATPase, partial [Elusimicrobiota bacterium]
RNPRLIESFRLPDAVVFGKRGVLTEGRPEVAGTILFGDWKEAAVLELLLAAEEGADHAFAGPLRAHASASRGPERRRSFEAVPTRGIAAVIGSRRVLVGSLPWLALHGIEPPASAALGLKGRTESLIGLAVDGSLAAVVALSAALRADAKACVARLQEGGLEPVLVSGDGNAAAYRAAEAAGVPKVYAEAGEEERLSVVEQLRSKGRRVAFLAGGMQDARALSRADVAFATAGAPFLVEEAADFILERGSLDSLLSALRLGMDIRSALRRNFAALFTVNAALIPLSAWAVYRGLALRPEYAAAAAVAGLAAVLASSSRIASTVEAP